jgi:hypothetical protein
VESGISEADLESRWFWSGWFVHDRSLCERSLLRCRLWWGDSVVVNPGDEGFGEECLFAAAVAEVTAGVDECWCWQVVAGGPLVPGVECSDVAFRVHEARVVSSEVVKGLFGVGAVAESALFVVQAGSLDEEGLGATGEFVESDLSGCDVRGGCGDVLACASTS